MNFKNYALTAIFGLLANLTNAQYVRYEEAQSYALISPTGVSNTGLVSFYKEHAGNYFIWNADTNTSTNIGGVAPGRGHGGLARFSEDGKYLSGTSLNPETGKSEISRFDVSTGKWTLLGSLGYFFDDSSSSGYEVSSDGSTIVGSAYIATGTTNSFVWNKDKGHTDLGSLIHKKSARANDVNKDGSVIVGWQDVIGQWKSAVWRRKADGTYSANEYLLVDPKGDPANLDNQLGEALAVSLDGKLIGGKGDAAMPNAWLWTEEKGMIDLGKFIDDPRATGRTIAINQDGTIAVGYYYVFIDTYTPPVYKSFIWLKKDNAIHDLNDYLKNTLKYDLGSDVVFVPNHISDNGKFITGWGRNSDNKSVVFRIQLPDSLLSVSDEIKTSEKATLYPNPVTNVLNIDTKEEIAQLKVYNMAGQQVLSKDVRSKNSQIDMSTLKAGVYLVEVTTGSNTATYKVIKK